MDATTRMNADPCKAGHRSWRLNLNGRFSLVDRNGRDVTPKGRKSRAIIAYLSAHPREHVRRDKLIDLLWGARFENQARLSLRQSLFEIRRSAGDSFISSDREHLWIEISVLEILDGKGERFAGLSGITPEFDDWLRLECERRGNEAFAELGREAERLLTEHKGEAARPLIEQMRQIDPLHEGWIRLAMRTDHEAANPSAIQRRFKEFSDSLDRELGSTPASETKALHDRLIADLTRKPPELQQPQEDSPARPEAKSGAAIEGGTQQVLAATPATVTLFRRRRTLFLSVAAIITLILIAATAREAALEERHQAEKMVEFMLDTSQQNMEQAGKIGAMEDVASRVVDYYGGKSNAQLSDAELRQRSRAFSLLGQVQEMRGDTIGAIRRYTEAAAGTAESVRRKPDDPKRLFDYSQNIFWIGELERNRGNVGSADSYLSNYKRLADRMGGLDPDDLSWRMDVLHARENLGIAFYSKRQFAEAVRQFADVLGSMQSVVLLDGTKSHYQKELMNVLGWLADAERASGRLNAAIAARQRQVIYLDQLISRGLEDVEFRERLVQANEALGILYGEQGQLDHAVSEHRLALKQAEQLLSGEPTNGTWMDIAANVRFELAGDLLALGKRDEAASEIGRACKVTDDLLRRDPTVARSRVLRTQCFSSASQLALESGSQSQALNFAKRALEAARSENSGDPIRDRYVLAGACRLMGDAYRQGGNSAAAMAAWSAGLAQLPSNLPERPFEMNEHSKLLSRLERTNEAAAINAKLNAIGYRRPPA